MHIWLFAFYNVTFASIYQWIDLFTHTSYDSNRKKEQWQWQWQWQWQSQQQWQQIIQTHRKNSSSMSNTCSIIMQNDQSHSKKQLDVLKMHAPSRFSSPFLSSYSIKRLLIDQYTSSLDWSIHFDGCINLAHKRPACNEANWAYLTISRFALIVCMQV